MGYQFGAVLAFAVVAILFALVMLFVGRLFRPRFPNDNKVSSWIKKGTGWVAFVELMLFTAVLLVGLAWAWAHGDLEWVKQLSSKPAKPAPVEPAEPSREKISLSA